MGIERGIEGTDPFGSEPVARLAGPEELRRTQRSTQLAAGTLACPECDAPALLAGPRAAPADPLACSFCGHAAAVRDFLSLRPPTRPTRVVVRVVMRERGRVG